MGAGADDDFEALIFRGGFEVAENLIEIRAGEGAAIGENGIVCVLPGGEIEGAILAMRLPVMRMDWFAMA